jgi:hypothetical protein
MGHRASRPIVVEVASGQTVYVPIARERSGITIQGSGAGAVAVDWTNDNITRGPANSYDVTTPRANGGEHVAPASAEWTVLQANVVTTPVVASPLQAMGLRLVGTVGTSVVVITQED